MDKRQMFPYSAYCRTVGFESPKALRFPVSGSPEVSPSGGTYPYRTDKHYNNEATSGRTQGVNRSMIAIMVDSVIA